MRTHPLSVIILAAGKGSRMKSQTAKVLHPVSGRPMLYHSIKAAKAISDDVTIVIAHQKEEVIETIGGLFDEITFAIQDIEQFPGTGGALMGIKPKNEKVLVLNGDMPLVTAEALKGFLEADADIIMSIFDLEDPSGYGRVVLSDAGVERIVEEKDATPEELTISHVNAGVYCFKRDVLAECLPRLNNHNAQEEYYLTDIIEMARDEHRRVLPLLIDEGHFKGVNSRADLEAADVIMQRRIKTAWMKAGVTMQLADTIYIEESVVFKGECVVENGVRITGTSSIENSHIKAHSVVEDSVMVDSDCGPMAHLRPGSALYGTHIGNFVETKKATLRGVKAGHLSYLGDAEIDEGTNIGAGTITCNYDGKSKYKTKIGKNVFVGSDTQIVAPCEIEDDVMIAAGTTVTGTKIDSGVLVVSRTPMKIVKNFYHKFFGKAES
ncbi:bifunctional UDP-N-acetylglucosamine diphosphorylase/glucosamine-1-phosphate N-acetyltransferase GlmU [Sulfurimonas sp. HSL-3221]|uniref:bifunctional UDP-N-acetylglucosamine diphosphorylase/glucosamine-1-phosphate N-acetyltransferase GlmU n=1 Tax=Thiomicrolovo sulfuroxydans TaxID=2894755 RepID=UPI001E36A188|nr:bifunctional UDP-N-acetylglucosamine diphosphorylase/glucosamine-1-phosphate N-acetyltransferase GlmU [Sulfurimonas sp. HSL-3221]UFS63604.1 bifunctional UDP-N-acetylglucosamine diphosphorylase/glucosamine-1-phosphate N-acetyltransferase GlmU [Sulfurimonas sp. HSL-3221]